jgi:PHD/YefM family antitoxin component YafN of YafNO toxin-antitoxin module
MAANEALTVAPVLEARQQLSRVLARFRAEGEHAAPLVLGSHRAPEGVLMSYARYRVILDELEELRALRARYEAHAEALASVRLEGQELDAFSHAVVARHVVGELSDERAIAQLDRHFGHPRATSPS